MAIVEQRATFECDQCGYEESTTDIYEFPEDWIRILEWPESDEELDLGYDLCSYHCVIGFAERRRDQR